MIMIITLLSYTTINSVQKMSATIFDTKRKDILKTQLWIEKNIDIKNKIITDQSLFAFSGVINHAIIYPSISLFLPFRIINNEIVNYQKDIENILVQEIETVGTSYNLNSERIKKHNNFLSNLNENQINQLSTYHSSNYLITKNEYEIFDLLYDSGTYKIYYINSTIF